MEENKGIFDNIYLLAQSILKLDIGDKRPTLDDIRETFKKVSDLYPEISKEQIDFIKRKIESNILADMGLGEYITDNSHKPWFIDFKADKKLYYWERYRSLLLQKKFVDKIVMKMDNVSDTIVDLIGNPNSEYMYLRRGLVIGDVQSGKTANYISLISKAADAGYKAIILLAGTLNTLRSQTQERVDEGFIGVDSSKLLKKEEFYVGVGKIDNERRPLSITTLDDDFNIRTARILQVQLKAYSEPVIFVIKKNVSVLNNLIKWFDTSTPEKQRASIPLLVIDDEADYASINTSKEDSDPTKTNKLIRDILSMFPKVCYVGFTATPFANVFINPDKPEDMLSDDLFPENFIYVLDSPTNYMGPESFFDDDNHEYLLEITDMDDFLPYKHKIGHELSDSLPISLREAIIMFFIINAIRDIRTDLFSHRTMLVNVSRFTSVQNELAEIILEFVYKWQRILKQYPLERAAVGEPKNCYEEILYLYKKHYKDTYDYSPRVLLEQVRVSTQKIIVTAVNNNNKADKVLNYKAHKENGLRVIAIGGITLSRGLTLEGLTISYFYRNSRYYDTLMQMGRWFGYRPGYEDLCRVFMSRETINWYGHIMDAANELKTEVKLMNSLGKTPKDFGLKVMSHPTTLLVTAPNKLRNSSSFVKNISLSEQVIETPRLHNNIKVTKENFIYLSDLINDLDKNSKSYLYNGKNPLFKDVNKGVIVRFVGNFKSHISNVHFQSREIAEYIDSNKKELNKWDVVFISGSSEIKYNIGGLSINPSVRKFVIRGNNGEIIQVSGNKNRLGSSIATRAGLTQEEIIRIRKEYKEENKNKKKKLAETATLYTTKAPNRNPLLMIYIIKLNNQDRKFYNELQIDENRITYGIGLAFPRMDDFKDRHFVEYKLNKTYYEQMFFDFEEYESEDD